MKVDSTIAPRAEAVLKEGPRRGQAAAARALLPWIKEQMGSGYSQQQIVNALAASGVPISLASLRKVLYPPR